jgi:Galactose oxidase-like, Early set domain/IPT/TIG domain
LKHDAPKRGTCCAVLFLFVLALAVSGAMAQVNVQGQWSTLPYLMPINPVHVALMYNGRVLVVSGSGNDPTNTNLRAAVWDPIAGTITVQTVAWDMFCNGMVVLPDGRPFINGGTLQYDPFHGALKSSLFDPATNTFTDVQNMAHGRWYPTVTTLGDGRVMTFSGSNETGGTNTAVEIYTPGTGWSTQYTANWTPPLYPRMHLLPNGKVFYSGSSVTSRLFDPVAHTWSTVGNTIYSGNRTYGSSVLLPLTPGNNYDPRVIIMGGGSPATKTTEIIDLGATTPSWQSGPMMTQARIEMNAVILPNGRVLAVGGSVNDEDASTASLNADLYNPDPLVNSFSSAGSNAYARLYHSNALLLPDATVWFAGGNPTRGTYEQHMEIYQPPYLFNANGTAATRPTITGAPGAIAWAGSFTVSTPDVANISSVVLIHPGAPTHAFDMDQRMVGLAFTKGSGTLTVTAPPNGNIAPPGYYMLFLLNSSGVPSVAKFTKLSATASAPPPTVSTVTPNTGSSNGGTGLTITGTNFLAGATVSLGGTAATGVTVVNSTSITATTAAHSAGAVNVVVTNTDAQSGTLPNGYTYITPDPAPTVTSVAPNTGTTAGGTSVNISGTGFLAGATVKMGGTSATGVTVLNSTTITATTLAHAAGAVSVVVTNSDAQAGTLPNGYTYTTGTGGGPIAFVQINAATPQTPSGSIILSYPLAQTAGNLNILAVGWNDTTSTVTSVSDSRGNTYSQAGTTISGTGLRQAIYFAKNILAGSNTVTVSFNQAAAYVDVRILEYSGLDPTNPLDATAGAAGSTSSPNSGAATTTSSNHLIFGAGITAGGFIAAGTGFTLRIITSPNRDIAEDQLGTSAGSYSVSAPLSASSAWVMQMATFRASGQGGGNPAPTVSSITPNTGTANGGNGVTIAGTGFLAGATVKLGGTAATGVSVASSTSITATAPAHAAGAVDVLVTNTDSQAGSLINGYTYTGTNPAPTVSSITPNTGTANGGTGVTITGTGFLTGATVKLGGTAATGVTVVSSTSIAAATPAHAAGAVSVVVTNTDAQAGTLTNGYTYTNPAPTVSSITPNSGTANGGTVVTITGTGFLTGATVKLGGTAATGVSLVSSTSITATTPAHASGAVSVVVTNTDAQAGTLTNGYTYTTTGGGGTIAFVQLNATTPQTPSASVQAAYPLPQTAGNLNIVAVGWNDTTSTVSSVSDSRGNTYTQAGTTISGTGLRQAIYYAKSILAGSNTVTVTFNQAAAYVDLRVLEYSGLDPTSPLDVTAGAAGNSSSPNSGAATTTSSNELIFGAGMTAGGFIAAGTGFTLRTITSPNRDIAEDQLGTTAGSYSTSAPLSSSSSWVMQVATFKAQP